MARDTFQLMRWALEVEGLTQPQAFVLYVLAARADAKRETIVGQSTLAKETRAAVKTVQRALNELERRGLILRTPRYRDGKRTSDTTLVKPDRCKPSRSGMTTGLSVPDLPDSDDQSEVVRVPGTTPLTTSNELPDTPRADARGGEMSSMMFERLLDMWPRRLDDKQHERARPLFERHLENGVQAAEIIEGARRFALSREWSDESRIVDLRGWLVNERWTDEYAPRVRAGRLSPASRALAVDLGAPKASKASSVLALTHGAGWFSENRTHAKDDAPE